MSAFVVHALAGRPHPIGDIPLVVDDPLAGDDFHLALYVCYELHYRGFDDGDDRWEWEPSLLALRASMEQAFELALRDLVVSAPAGPIEDRLFSLVRSDEGPSLSIYLQDRGTADEFREFVVHRSAYQLKEADPHTWAIPRLRGRAKASLIEIQSDEYGHGSEHDMHSSLFATSMRALDLDPGYGAYLDLIPGVTLATVNLMSMFGLHRRLRGAIVGHLAAFEMTSTEPNRRYAEGLRRLGFTGSAMRFYLEHVEADATHEVLAARHLAGSLAKDEPAIADDIAFGAASLLALEKRFAEHLIGRWTAGCSSLREPLAVALSA